MTRAWCRTDPTGSANNHGFTLEVAIAADTAAAAAAAITGPIRLDLYRPAECDASFETASDPKNGFGHGYDVHWHTDTGLHCGEGSNGSFCQIAATALIPATLDPDGHQWACELTMKGSGANPDSDLKAFRTNSTSGRVIARI